MTRRLPSSLHPLVLGVFLVGCSGDKGSADSATPPHTGETGQTGPTAVWEEAFDTSSAGALSGVWGAYPPAKATRKSLVFAGGQAPQAPFET